MKHDPYVYPDGEWMQKRAGSFTSSQIGCLFTEPRTKAAKEAGELSETAKTYIMQKVSELLTGTVRNTFRTPEMEWGLIQEPYAIELLQDKYKGLTYYGAENPKFFQYSDFSGGSPDAVSYEDKLVFEIKCPNPTTHIEYLLCENDIKSMNKEYWYQIQMNIACVAHELDINPMELKGVFVSYCPLMIEPKLRLAIYDVPADEEFQTNFPNVISKAENYLRTIIDKFNL